MAIINNLASQYLDRFGSASIPCSPYVIAKLGIDRSRCFIKLGEYMILSVPYQLGFKRAIFIASISKQELTFFKKYVNNLAGLSMSFIRPRQEPLKLFIHCTLASVGMLKGREDVGAFIVDYKTTPEDLSVIMGQFIEYEDQVRQNYDIFSNRSIKMTADAARLMGYNLYATISMAGQQERRIQIFNLSTKMVEHLEAAGAPLRPPGTQVAYHIYFKKYRVSTPGRILASSVLPQGIVRTGSELPYSPELVEIIGDYLIAEKNQPKKAVS